MVDVVTIDKVFNGKPITVPQGNSLIPDSVRWSFYIGAIVFIVKRWNLVFYLQ